MYKLPNFVGYWKCCSLSKPLYVLLESFSIIIYSHHSVPLVLTTWFFGKQRWTKRDQSAYSCQQKIPTAHFDEKAVQTKPSLPFLFFSLFWTYNWFDNFKLFPCDIQKRNPFRGPSKDAYFQSWFLRIPVFVSQKSVKLKIYGI